MEKLLKRDEVAALLGVEPRTLDNWAHRGEGPPFVKIGGLRRYDPVDLRAWVNEKKVAR